MATRAALGPHLARSEVEKLRSLSVRWCWLISGAPRNSRSTACEVASYLRTISHLPRARLVAAPLWSSLELTRLWTRGSSDALRGGPPWVWSSEEPTSEL